MSAANSRTVVVEWGDCDPAGIVFYPRYFAMFDTSTARLIEAVAGKRKADLIAAHGIVGWPMVETSARFTVPVSFGDEVRIDSSITNVGRSSFGIAHRLLKGETLCVEATEVRVWAAPNPDRPGAIRGIAIPEALAAALRAELLRHLPKPAT